MIMFMYAAIAIGFLIFILSRLAITGSRLSILRGRCLTSLLQVILVDSEETVDQAPTD
jgi:hypothetical protein